MLLVLIVSHLGGAVNGLLGMQRHQYVSDSISVELSFGVQSITIDAYEYTYTPFPEARPTCGALTVRTVECGLEN